MQAIRLAGQAAVLILVAGQGEQQRVLLAKRSSHLNSHGGEVGFPGGKWERGDASLKHTALRETFEEVAIAPESVRLWGQLPPSCTRRGVCVTPFVGEVPETVCAVPNSDEFSECFWVGKSLLLEDRRQRTDIFVVAGDEYWSPAYQFGGHTVWGFTARVLVQFINRYWGGDLTLSHPSAPIVRHGYQK